MARTPGAHSDSMHRVHSVAFLSVTRLFQTRTTTGCHQRSTCTAQREWTAGVAGIEEIRAHEKEHKGGGWVGISLHALKSLHRDEDAEAPATDVQC